MPACSAQLRTAPRRPRGATPPRPLPNHPPPHHTTPSRAQPTMPDLPRRAPLFPAPHPASPPESRDSRPGRTVPARHRFQRTSRPPTRSRPPATRRRTWGGGKLDEWRGAGGGAGDSDRGAADTRGSAVMPREERGGHRVRRVDVGLAVEQQPRGLEVAVLGGLDQGGPAVLWTCAAGSREEGAGSWGWWSSGQLACAHTSCARLPMHGWGNR